jgi:hypothetical protein
MKLTLHSLILRLILLKWLRFSDSLVFTFIYKELVNIFIDGL